MIEPTPAELYLASTRCYLTLPENPQDYVVAFAKLRKEWEILFTNLVALQDTDNPEVWFALGHGYGNGWGTEGDSEVSEEWFRRAADSGHTDAMSRLAQRLTHPDRQEFLPEAIQLLLSAAAALNPSAMVQLGFAYREGRGVELSAKIAVEWFMKAYQAGDLHAAIHAGRILLYPLKQYEEAASWFLLAAKANQSESFINLAMIYDDRESKLHDPAEVVKWHQTNVAKNGSSVPRSLVALARHYRDGSGVPKSTEIASIWLKMLFSKTTDSNEFYCEGKLLLEDIESNLLLDHAGPNPQLCL
jgi:TPR repeat protein